MLSKSIINYIVFGTVLQYLKGVQLGTRVDYILGWINKFLNCLAEFHLPITSRASYELENLKNELSKTDPSHLITAGEASNINRVLVDIEKTLLAEATGNVAFIVTDKRMDVNKLLYDIKSLMTPGVFDLLPDIAKNDFSEAGKCIAFERPTASAFHLLRGTESVLRIFYCTIIKQKRVKPLNWGPMVNHLRKRRRPPSKELLNNLDNIRNSFRNPTQHPEKTYDIEEVQNLFSLCIDVVDRMIKGLPK